MSVLNHCSRNIPALFLALALGVPCHTLDAENLIESEPIPAFYGMDSNNTLVHLDDLLEATTWYNNGIYGQNTTAWVVDAQLVGTNLYPAEAISNLAYTYASPDTVTNAGLHATWCASLLGGYAPTTNGAFYYYNTGIAPLTTLGSAALATSINSDGSFAISTSSISAYGYAASHANVISTSIGDSSDAAGAGVLSLVVDSAAAANPNTTIVAAAGNNGPSAGSVGGPASSYNVISVGALDGPPYYNVLASFSSVGPQPTAWYNGTNTYYYDNGATTRPGVDLVAPGTSIVVVQSITSNSYTYYSLAGTSFATPLVTGGATLLDSASTYFPSGLTNAATQSVVVKAVLLNSADKLAGWNNGQQITNEVLTTTQALDYAIGAGEVDLTKAFAQYTTSAHVDTFPGFSATGFNDLIQNEGWGYDTALLGGTNRYQFASELYSGEQIAITLCWLRDSSWNSAVGSYVDIAQAELDLMVYRVLPGGSDQMVAQSISPVSTTQELYFQLQDSGNYFLAVDYSTNLFGLSDNYDSQPYGLAWAVDDVPEPRDILLVSLGGVFALFRLRFCRNSCSGLA